MREQARALDRGRALFGEHAWAAAYAELRVADAESPLGADDLERLATAAYLTGRDDECLGYWGRAHRERLSAGEAAGAARAGFWLSLISLLRGEAAQAAGWLARTQRLLEERRVDSVERGYVLIVVGLQEMGGHDPAKAYATYVEAAEIAQRFGDADLSAMARLSMGEALIERGDISGGVRLFDEVMAGVTVGDVSPVVCGILYCAMISSCYEISDFRRATEWTDAFSDWCAAQPDVVPFRGRCLVHRSQIMQLGGAWVDAAEEAQRACDLLGSVGTPVVGTAFYQMGELHRLHGEFEQAELAYGSASEWGVEPQPGLALLWLAQGRIDVAAAAIERVVGEQQSAPARSKLLGPYVEIMLAANDIGAAHTRCTEFSGLAAQVGTAFLRATAAQTEGSVLLAEGDARSGLDPLRQAYDIWRELEAPYELARVRVLIGLACRKLGDHESARMHFDAARSVFRRLGAAVDLAQLDKLLVQAAPAATGLLTRRELEVLGKIAAGKTNREIAATLFLSEKTVARHVSNILTKLGLSSRSAATAYAYQHELV